MFGDDFDSDSSQRRWRCRDIKGAAVLLTFQSQIESSKAVRLVSSYYINSDAYRSGRSDRGVDRSTVALLCTNVLVFRSKDDGVIR